MSPNKPKIVIAGGGIAGLTLANILEQIGIDYVVLEAYGEIAPQAGASIGLMPHGLRIFDQLGCYERIRSLVDEPIKYYSINGPDGRSIGSTLDGPGHTFIKHGYPVIFIDRQLVIQTLYDNLKDKSKILTAKRVARVEHQQSSVAIKCDDDSTYTGDMLVGADGIHSTIRDEMWRIADSAEPGYIPPSEKTALPCRYKCIFGISLMDEQVRPATLLNVLNEGFSYLVASGPRGRVYWFLFVRMEKTHYSPNIPRFTKQDEEKVVAAHRNDRISDTIVFGDLYDKRLKSVLTGLEEYMFRKWYYGRIVTVGDAVHKSHPIFGHGGNAAIETVAALANALYKAIDSDPDRAFSTAALASAFQEMQNVRSERAKHVVESATELQRLSAGETLHHRLLRKYILPYANPEGSADVQGGIFAQAVRLNMLEVPARHRVDPYVDELASKPLGMLFAPAGALVACMVALFLVALKALQINPPDGPLLFAGEPVKATYTGVAGIDALLQILVSAFATSVAQQAEPAQRLQAIYFLGSLLPVAVIWTAEAHRYSNTQSLISWTTLWGLAYQLFGIAKIAPLYFLAHLWTTTTRTAPFARPSSRPVPATVSRAILPAACLGFALPTALMFLPSDDAALAQNAIAIWQAFPLWVSLLTRIVSRIVGRFAERADADVRFENADLPHLRGAYAYAFFTNAVVHVAVLFAIGGSAEVGFGDVFGRLASPFVARPPGSLAEEVFGFMEWDMWIFFAAVGCWSLWSVVHLRCLGCVSSLHAVGLGVGFLVGSVAVGPAAAYAGLWWWREGVMAFPRRV